MTDILTHKIIVIDDHFETLSIIQRVLQQHGYDVQATTDPVEGIAWTKTTLPDMVMVDGMMPGMSGWDVCRELRAVPALSELRIIMFSAVSEAEQKLASFDAGADDYMTKPTEPVEMIERVKILLENVSPRPSSPTSAPVSNETQTLAFEDLDLPPLSSESEVRLPAQTTLIAVMGVRGGSGTTTAAINIATALAHSGHETTLVDLDLLQGHIALYLKQNTDHGLHQLISQESDNVQEQLTSFGDSFKLLLTRTNVWEDGTTALSADEIMTIISSLAETSAYVVVDCGNQLLPFMKPIIEQAHEIVVCLRPERLSLTVAKEKIALLSGVMRPQGKLRPIVLDFSGHMNVPKEGIENFLRLQLTAVIPITAKEMNLAVSKSKPIVQLNPQAKPSILLRQLAQQMVKV